MQHLKFPRNAVCLVMLVFVVGAVAWGQDEDQDPTGGIRGTIAAASGDRLPGARITLGGGPGPAVDMNADEAGDYVLLKVPEGKYHMIVSAKGFKAFEADVEVFSEMVDLDVSLEPDRDAKPAPQMVYARILGRQLR
jgi:Carboxypeptidase regulatory-like domain